MSQFKQSTIGELWDTEEELERHYQDPNEYNGFFIPEISHWNNLKDKKHDIGTELNKAVEAIEEIKLAIEKYDEMVAEQEDADRDFSATRYQRDRKEEYDKLNQFELQYDDSIDNGTRWADAIQAIKDAHPKP